MILQMQSVFTRNLLSINMVFLRVLWKNYLRISSKQYHDVKLISICSKLTPTKDSDTSLISSWKKEICFIHDDRFAIFRY